MGNFVDLFYIQITIVWYLEFWHIGQKFRACFYLARSVLLLTKLGQPDTDSNRYTRNNHWQN